MKSAQILLKDCRLHGEYLRRRSLSKAFVEDGKELFNTVAQIGRTGGWHTTCGLGSFAQSRGATCTREHMPTLCSMSSWMLPGASWSSEFFAAHKNLSPDFADDMRKPWVRGVSFATVSGVLCALLCVLLF